MTLKKRPVGESGLLRPLAKGKACAQCKARKVRCDAALPACGSCTRTAQFSNQEPGSICCTYLDASIAARNDHKKKEVHLKRPRSNDLEQIATREQSARHSAVNKIAPLTFRALQPLLTHPLPPPLVRSAYSSSSTITSGSSSSNSAYTQMDSASSASNKTYSLPGSPPTPSQSEDLFAHAFRNNTFVAALPPNPDFCRISPSGWASLTPQPFDANHYPIQNPPYQPQYQYQPKPVPHSIPLVRRDSQTQLPQQQQQQQQQQQYPQVQLNFPQLPQQQQYHQQQQQQQQQYVPLPQTSSIPQYQSQPMQQSHSIQSSHSSNQVPSSPSLFASTIQKTYAFPSHLFHSQSKPASLPQDHSPYPQTTFPTLVSPRSVLHNNVNGYFDVPQPAAQLSPVYPFKLTPGFENPQFGNIPMEQNYFGVDWSAAHGNNGTMSSVDAGRWTPGVGWRAGEDRWVM